MYCVDMIAKIAELSCMANLVGDQPVSANFGYATLEQVLNE